MLLSKLAALVDLILVILEFSGFVHLRGLPLGGGQIQQLGIVFASAYVVAEFIDLFKGPPSRNGTRWRARRHGHCMKTLLEQYRRMRGDAAKQLESLESGRTRVSKHLPDGDIADGTADQIALLRQTIAELDEAIRKVELH